MRVGIVSLVIITAAVQLLSATTLKGQTIDQVEVNLELKNESLVKAFKKIESQTAFHFMYRNEDVKNIQNLNVQQSKQTIASFLSTLLQNTQLGYKQLDQRILITPKSGTDDHTADNAAKEEVKEGIKPTLNGILSGTVSDNKSNKLPGVTIRLDGPASKAVATDPNGNYAFTNLPDGQYTLTFTFLGYAKLTRQVTIAGANTTLNVILAETANNLTEVVVVAYGTQRKETVTGAISTIDNKQLVQSPVASVGNSLVGRLPGIVAIQQSGEPGRDQSRIKLRGIGTLFDDARSDALVLVDGVERNMNQLDPNEIASVSVLKDASSTAVFGVRGANGVILITTKTGTAGKTAVGYTSNFGLQTITSVPQTLNAFDYATLKNEGLVNDGKTPYFSATDLQKYKDGSDPVFHPDMNWYKEVLKPSSLQQMHNVNLNGGTTNAKYFVSLGYLNQDGVYKGSPLNQDYSSDPNYKRYNLRSNVNFNANKNLTMALNIGGQFTNANYTGQTAAGSSQPLWQSLLKTNPLSTPGLIDDKLIGTVEGTPGSNIVNPWANIIGVGYQQVFGTTLNTNFSVKHKLDFITKGLSVRGMTAYDYASSMTTTRNKPITTYNIIKNPATLAPIYVPVGEDAPFTFSQSLTRTTKFYTEAAIEYNRSYGKHTITALTLGTIEKSYTPTLAYKIPSGYMGAVGRVTYNFANRYFGEVNMGYNGSENFPEGKRFGFFPAYSLGWNVSEEPFFPKNNIVTYLKFRGSYGEVGNDKIGGNRFLYLPTVYTRTTQSYFLGTVGTNYTNVGGYQEGLIGNPNVTWERSKKANIGLETYLFKDKLSVVVDLFVENRDNILTNLLTVPALVQATLPAVNIGKVRNQGFEVEFNYKDKIGQFSYRVGGNFSQAKNKIEFMDEPTKAFPYLQQTGNPVGQYFGLIWDGYYNTPEELATRPVSNWSANNLQLGDLKYRDVNGDGKLNENDFVPMGYSIFPQQTFGFSLGGEFKGFDFTVLFQGANKVSTKLNEMAAWPFDTDWATAFQVHMLRWTPQRYANGDDIEFPRVTASPVAGQHNTQSSGFYIKDASYVRLKNLEIGYSFNGKFLTRAGINKLRVYSNANNLYTWSKMKNFDPEAPPGRGEFYPQMRVINFGLSLQF